MEIAPAGVPLTFEATFDADDLFVAMSVFDDSGEEPVQVLAPTAMDLVVGNTYRAKFTAESKNYIILKAVYTNGSFTTLDPTYPQQSESIVAEYLNSSSGGPILGFVDNLNPVVGLVNC